MTEKLKKHKDMAFLAAFGFILAIIGMLVISGMVALPSFASQATDAVAVTAYVRSLIVFSVNPTAVTLIPDLIDTLGNPTVGSSTAVSLMLGTNAGGGWNITIRGTNGGLASTTATTSLIATVPITSSSTLSAGIDGYGANATTTLAGVSLFLYDNWGTQKVAAISSTTPQTLAQKNSANASTTVAQIKIYAAATSSKAVGTYTDTIILTATSQ